MTGGGRLGTNVVATLNINKNDDAIFFEGMQIHSVPLEVFKYSLPPGPINNGALVMIHGERNLKMDKFQISH